MAEKLIPSGTPNDGLPENWRPIEEPALAAVSPPAAFSSVSPSPYFAGSIPLSHQLVPDIMPTRYPGGIGGYRVSPPIPAASAGINSAIQSIIDQQPVAAEVAVTATGGAHVLNGNYTAVASDVQKLLVFETVNTNLSVINTGSANSTSTIGSISAGLNIEAGNLLVVVIRMRGASSSPTVTALTDTIGNTYQKAVSGQASNQGVEIWWVLNQTGDICNEVKAVFSVNSTVSAIQIFQVQGATGLDTTTSVVSFSSATTATSSSFSTTQARDISFIAAAATGSPSTPLYTQSTNYVLVQNGNSPLNVGLEFQIFTTKQVSVTGGFTMGASVSGLIIGAIFLGPVLAAGGGDYTLTLPATPPSSTWSIEVTNGGTGNLTVYPNGKKLDGSANSFVLLPGLGLSIETDGTNYYSNRGLARTPFDPTLTKTQISPVPFYSLTWGNQFTNRSGNTQICAFASLTPQNAVHLTNQGVAGPTVSFLYKAAPATPWSLTIGLHPCAVTTGSAGTGLVLRESSSGKLIAFWSSFNGIGGLQVEKYSSYIATSAGYLPNIFTPQDAVWLRVTNDGTNLTWSYSGDGHRFVQYVQKTLTDFFTAGPDEVGIGIDANNGTLPTDAFFFHWQGI